MTIIVGLIVGAVIVFLIWFSYKGWKALWKDISIKIKRNELLKDETLLNWCLNADKQGLTPAQVRKVWLLTNKNSERRIDEVVFVYKEVQKSMKGGDKNDKNKFSEQNRRTEETKLPSFSS